MSVIKLTCEIEWFREALSEAGSLFEAGELPPELRRQALSLFESPSQFVCFDRDLVPTGRADEYRVRLKPSDGFLNFLLALRAWNRELKVTV
jgi:hypothetical protein